MGFISHLHAFRGFAIVSIVAGHSFSFQAAKAPDANLYPSTSVLDVAADVLFHGSTLYFALISGLLFSLVLKRRGWRDFFGSKFRNILLPYIVVTIMFTYYGLNDRLMLGTPFEGSVGTFAHAVLINLASGGAIFPLWYMPVLFCLYALTPLLAELLSGKKIPWIFWLLLAAPLVFSRDWPDHPATTLVYFLGAYAAGMLAGERYREALDFVERHKRTFIWIAGISTLLVIASFALHIEWLGPASVRKSLFYVQKLSIAALVLHWFAANEARLPAILGTLGTYAFPIYFLHAIFMVLFIEAQLILVPEFPTIPVTILFGFMTLAFALAPPVAITRLAQFFLGARSRMLVGA